MKKRYLSTAIAITLACSMVTTSCIGSFTMSNSLLSWNKSVGNKIVNEIVFFAFWLLPAYEITLLADVLVLNSIEFWSGSNPLTSSTKVVDGANGKYLVQQDPDGYTIKSLEDETQIRLDYDGDENAWDIVDPETGEARRLMTFVDDTHVAVPSPDGSDMIVELSQAGAFAYQQIITNTALSID